MNWIVRSFSRTKSWLFSISVCSLDMWHWFALTQEMIAELRRETSSQIAAGSSVARRGMRHRQATLPHWFKMCQTFRFFPDLFLRVFKKIIKEKKNNMNIMLKKVSCLGKKLTCWHRITWITLRVYIYYICIWLCLSFRAVLSLRPRLQIYSLQSPLALHSSSLCFFHPALHISWPIWGRRSVTQSHNCC